MAHKDPEKRREYNRNYYKKWNAENQDRLKEYDSRYKSSDKAREAIKSREATPEFKELRRASKLRRRYRLSTEQYDERLAAQGGVCACCKRPETFLHRTTGEPRRLCVDHCHTTGAVRGLLCTKCNLLVGTARDEPALLESAAAYLRRTNA